MSGKRSLIFLATALPLVIGFLALTTRVLAATKEAVLYSFCSANGCADGANPQYGNLVADGAGNLYGTTVGGGAQGYGTVFQLVPRSDGKWTENVLYSFTNQSGDGAYPIASLIFDAAGNLYGTTGGGGVSSQSCGDPGCGVVFQLVPGMNGTWTENVLYEFCSLQNCADGIQPQAGLIFDAAGNLDGTTFYGGLGLGTVFQLTRGKNGEWREKVLYNFCTVAECADGASPSCTLISDAAGNLYGTTTGGGTNPEGGVAFQLTPATKGQWTETVVHNFGLGDDGLIPLAGLIFDAAGNLYGTTGGGGPSFGGVVFELSPGNGTWSEKVLHGFNDKDGETVYSGLIFDASGNLYGTTLDGGASGTACGGRGCGAVFQLRPGAKGRWTEKVLHSFKANGKDGNNPYAGLIFGMDGNLYGTTSSGGTNNAGTLFEIAP